MSELRFHGHENTNENKKFTFVLNTVRIPHTPEIRNIQFLI